MFEVPNLADAAYAEQSQLDSRDFGDILAPVTTTGVVDGCAVTAQGAPDMTVAVAAGLCIVDNLRAYVTAGNVTITEADATHARFDLICVSNLGTKSAVAGTPAESPVFPDPEGKAVLAAVYVPAEATSITSDEINDRRVIAPEMLGVGGAWRAGTSYFGPPGPVTSGSGIFNTANLLAVYPRWLPKGFKLDRIGLYIIATADALIRLGIYYSNASFPLPGPLWFEAGTVDTNDDTGLAITIDQTVPKTGVYWFAAVRQGSGTPQAVLLDNGAHYGPWSGGLVYFGSNSGLQLSGAALNCWSHGGTVDGALPSTFTPSSRVDSGLPRILVRSSTS